MNITSQFFITYYTGSQDLDLMAMPVSFAGNIGKISEYNRFIEAISSIYAAQSFGVNAAIAGEIPVFWTVRSLSTDAAGNTRYSYTASPQSTLIKLEPKKSYYIILRDISYIPLKIPTVGFPVIGFTDNILMPSIQKDSILTKTLKGIGNNTYNFSRLINNLQAYETYKYQVYGVDSNWPITMVPGSGLIRPSTQQLKLDIRAAFCSSTGVCPSGSANVINYTQNPPTSDNDTRDLYGVFQIGIQPISYDGIETISDQFTLYCEDCLPKLRVVVPGYIPNISVVNSGTGYRSAPNVTIIPASEDTLGEGAIAKTLFNTENKDFSITMENVGKNYLFAPTVIIDGGGGMGATATALIRQEKNKTVIAGGITDIVIGVENIYQDHTYAIRSKQSNYPSVILHATGLLKSTPTHKARINTKLTFCDSLIKCPSGTPGLLNYVVESGLFTKASAPYVDLEIVLLSTDTNASEITSSLLSVSCPLCTNNLSRFISSVPEITIQADIRQNDPIIEVPCAHPPIPPIPPVPPVPAAPVPAAPVPAAPVPAAPVPAAPVPANPSMPMPVPANPSMPMPMSMPQNPYPPNYPPTI